MKYKCKICGYIYEEKIKDEVLSFPNSWKCPDCGVPFTYFQKLDNVPPKAISKVAIKGSNESIYIKVNEGCHSIKRDDKLCVYCGSCKNACKNQGVCGYFKQDKNLCIDCGQCTLVCPTGAIDVKNDIEKVKLALADKDKIVIFQTAPAVRVAIGEAFGLPYGQACEGKLVSALRKLGAKYVFDTTFGADLTIMEEASELIERINKKGIMPMFTSCCPAWVKFAEIFYPEFLPNLSSTKSPILMQGAIIKTYFAKVMNIEPNKIVSIAITPCSAKKAEIRRDEMNASAKYNKLPSLRDIDYVLTVRELTKWLKDEKVDFNNLPESLYDSPLGKASGGGVIFGNSGGVMESALRSAHFILTEKELDKVEFKQVRGAKGIKKAEVALGNTTLKVAVVAGTSNVRKLLQDIKNGEHFDFVEVMACPNGCISGGGQPKANKTLLKEIYKNRTNGLYKLDKASKIKCSYQNKDIQKLYAEFLGKPLSKLSQALLHTAYTDRSDILGK